MKDKSVVELLETKMGRNQHCTKMKTESKVGTPNSGRNSKLRPEKHCDFRTYERSESCLALGQLSEKVHVTEM